MADRYANRLPSPTFPARRIRPVTFSDTEDFPHGPARLLCTEGSVITFLPVDNPDDEPITMSVTYRNSHRILPIIVRRVFETGTDPFMVGHVYAVEE
ncbi:spike base protein, RCAP_Rcc01079 family [Mongoliimonas terrestris]|uniref:spike base protein, RCAP_Rcc01079 family n=1 Tax=Mongoliimonas terrestris TaxID=1709001 RepID=UPI000949966F|nr:hypothetical protein [Mongoliimonas terrestris]